MDALLIDREAASSQGPAWSTSLLKRVQIHFFKMNYHTGEKSSKAGRGKTVIYVSAINICCTLPITFG